jgi:biofilm PGA synthesis N-glycosyltransferase PgaC
MSKARLAIGICAYNEENNIGPLLQNLISEQDLREDCEILVVCSGCNDDTPVIARRFQQYDARVHLVIENQRRGKANALNGIFRRIRDQAQFLVLVNADALPEKGSINKLIMKLADSEVAAAFARPVPSRNSRGVCSEMARLVWHLHHIISMSGTPKLSGELCAIRTRDLKEIPEDAVTDEPYLEKAILEQRRRISYVPKATVCVRCPTKIVDLIKQRKRIWIGHIQLRATTGYTVSTASARNILHAVTSLRLRETPYLLLGAFLEMVSYLQARAAFSRGAIPFAWEPIASTKNTQTDTIIRDKIASRES